MEEAIVVFVLNLVSSCIGTLKNMFMVKDYKVVTFFVSLIDAVLYYYILRSVATSGDGLYMMLAFVLGKTFGVTVAGFLENLLAIGTIEVSLYLSDTDLTKQALARLKELGFSVTMYTALTPDLGNRFMVEIQLPRKKFKLLKKSLKSLGVEVPTTAVRDLKSVSGKIEDRI